MKQWKQKTKKEKFVFITRIVLWSLAALLVIFALFAQQIFGDSASAFQLVFGDSEGGFSMIGNWINDQIPVFITAAVYIIIVIAVSRLLRFVIARFLLISKKGQTGANLISSFIKYFTAIVIILMVLLIFGVDPLALFASIGILGLVIGLGAQSLISDIISGLFIVFEGEYQVGDYIVIDGFRGKVAGIGIRTTQFVDYGGNIKIINNSEIKTVVNLSYQDSLLYVDVKIKHSDFKKAEEAIEKNMEKMIEQLPQFTYGPRYVGVSDFANEGIQLKFIGKVDEEIRFQSERDLRRAIKVLFDEAQIDIALPKMYIKDTKDGTIY